MKHDKYRLFVFVVSLAGLLAAPTVAQDFSIDWWTLDGGGDMFTSGGDFEISGTLGQPDAAQVAGADFSLTGGFWGGVTGILVEPTITPTPETSTPTPSCVADADLDQICDDVEGGKSPALDETNTYLPDSDGDGLGDGTEDSNRNGVFPEPGETNPRTCDTDGDEYEDGVEVLLLSSDPLTSSDPAEPYADADGDGLPDACDPSPTNPDTDADRFLDGYETLLLGLPAASDPGQRPSLGDVDKNGNWDNADSQLILNFFAYIPTVPSFDFTQTDVDRNGVIDNADAQHMLNYFAHIQPELPAR